MKITKSQLKQIIEEEISEMRGIKWPKISVEKIPSVQDQFEEIIREMEKEGLEKFSSRLENWFESIRYDLPDPTGEEYNKHKKHSLEEGDNYPAPSRMKKLVAQAKLDARYQQDDIKQLKKDYDKHVRGTLRDPKHADAHKK